MILGIDLGTTNSAAAFWTKEGVQLIPNALGRFLTPSVVSVDQDMILVGEPALQRLVTYPDQTIANFKRSMGTNTLFKLDNFTFRAEELSALILKQIKEDAESFLNQKVEEAIISVPAYFSDAQRKATKYAAELAGLKVERLINEPTAAGIAYGLQENIEDSHYLIFDLGGGTFDVTILNMFSNIIEVNASNGDNCLGGIDFTQILAEKFIAQLIKEENCAKTDIPPSILNKITEQAELAKHKFSTEDKALIKILWDDTFYEYSFDFADFEKEIEPLLTRIKTPIKKIINDAKLTPNDIEQIVLVGGSSRMRSVKSLVARMFGKLPLSHIDPDLVIAKGVAIAASLKAKNKDLNEIIVTDICPYSLGLAVWDSENEIRYFDPIIERNMAIPLSRSNIYHPSTEKQTEIDIDIYQGESFQLENNILLGSLTVPVSRQLKDRSVEVRFTYDINGLLEVETKLNETGEIKTLVIENNPGLLSAEEIALRLEAFKKLKIHPREETKNKFLLARAERLYEEIRGQLRTHLNVEIRKFLQILNSGDNVAILKAYIHLNDLLEQIENDYTPL
ncbi:MAG: Hsp70 family protein [Proteobacteria bacterium]|nr:Hsp70 family protein [Pseudomonadota bacterium]